MKTAIFTIAITTLCSFAFAEPPDRAAFHAAMEECANELGIEMPDPKSRSRDSRPSKEIMEQIKSCMSEKGFERPEGRPPRRD